MRTMGELWQFYKTDLLPELTVLEDIRKKVKSKVVIILVCAIGGGILLALLGLAIHPAVSMIIVAGAIAIGIWQYTKVTKEYISQFKFGVIDRLVKFIDPNLNYSKDSCIPYQTYMSSKIFPRTPDRYRGDDYVWGTLGNTQVAFSELHTEYKTESTDSKGHRSEHWHTIFRGLFFVGDFNKNFTTETLVLPDTAEKMFGKVLGGMFQSWNFTRGKLIKLEDPEFEKYFVVYGNDQVEARYILSTSLMKRIVDFRKKANKDIYLSFVNNKIFVAISYRENLFEPRIFKTLLTFEPIQKYFEDLTLAVGIVEDLNLNTRIWSKE